MRFGYEVVLVHMFKSLRMRRGVGEKRECEPDIKSLRKDRDCPGGSVDNS